MSPVEEERVSVDISLLKAKGTQKEYSVKIVYSKYPKNEFIGFSNFFCLI